MFHISLLKYNIIYNLMIYNLILKLKYKKLKIKINYYTYNIYLNVLLMIIISDLLDYIIKWFTKIFKNTSIKSLFSSFVTTLR